MPPLEPAGWVPGALAAMPGWHPASGVRAFGFLCQPYGVPGLRFLGAGTWMGPWALMVRQYGNQLYRHLRVDVATATADGWVAALGVETVRFGALTRPGGWLEAGGTLMAGSRGTFRATGWFHVLEGGHRWAGFRLTALWVPSRNTRLAAALTLEPEGPLSLSWGFRYPVHRLLAFTLGYRSSPPLVACTLTLRTRPALVYSVAYHPDLALSHTWGLVWTEGGGL